MIKGSSKEEEEKRTTPTITPPTATTLLSSTNNTTNPPNTPPPIIIRALTFDLDDTLWNADDVLNRAYVAMYVHVQAQWPNISAAYSLEGFAEVMMTVAKHHVTRAYDYTFLRKTALEQVALECGYEPLQVIDSCFPAFLIPRSTPTLFPGVLSSLTALRQRGYVLGVITNGNADLSYLPDLHVLFDFIVRAEDVQAPKPSSVPFQEALGHITRCWRLKHPVTSTLTASTEDDGGHEDHVKEGSGFNQEVAPEQVVHVGDCYRGDITGAKQMGMRTIWVTNTTPATLSSGSASPSSPTGRGAEENTHADARVQDITSVGTILDQWLGL